MIFFFCRHAEELIGMMKNHVPCLEPGCKTEYGLDVLKVKRMLPCPI